MGQPQPEKQRGTLHIENVSKTFSGRGGEGRVLAVDTVSLEIEQGEFLTLLGPSGCGKTTTLRLLAGFEIPTSGRILLDGKDITNRPPNKRDMAMVFQSYALFPHMNVFDNVAYGLQVRSESRTTIRDKVANILAQVGLTSMENRRAHELSGGQQQRVALARALIMEPRVLLFDEPLSNLDAKLRVQMRSEIRSLQRRMNITSVYVTHDQAEAMALSDRIVVMNGGRIEQIGPPHEIYRHPVSRFVADFIGRANFVQTVVETLQDGQAHINLFGQTIMVALHNEAYSGQAVTAVLRPEGLILRSDANLTQVAIQQVMYLGSEIEYIVKVNGQSLVVVDSDTSAARIFQEGETVGLGFHTSSIHLLLD